jgi:hypothetical protein
LSASRYNNKSVVISVAGISGATYLLLLPNIVRCALEVNAEKRNRSVRRFFIMLGYKPKADFWALKMFVIAASVKAVEYTMAVPILPVNALEALALGSQAMKKLSPDKAAWVTVLVAVVIPLALQR